MWLDSGDSSVEVDAGSTYRVKARSFECLFLDFKSDFSDVPEHTINPAHCPLPLHRWQIDFFAGQ